MKFPFKLIDLTHTVTSSSPTWTGDCGFNHRTTTDYQDCDTTVKFRVQDIAMHAGIGTHMDAPAHCVPGANTIDQIPLDDLLSPCIVVDVSSSADENYKISVSDIHDFETKHGKIPKQSLVLFHTGWSRYWDEPNKYHNNYRFPSIDSDCAEYLIERNVNGLGIDTLSPDVPNSGFPVHKLILGAGKYIVENVANLHLISATDNYVLSAPIRGAGLTESPVRLIALCS